MLKKLLLCLTAVSFSLTTFAQSVADIQLPKMLPPSPDAAELGKYGQMPVDKSTGIPDISIPLYEIKTPRFNLPISLSYHASGIKVDEVASWVGMGWCLNAGGVVTRSMVGIADNIAGAGYMSNPYGLPNANALFNNFHADSMYMENVAQDINDSQPDNYFYNFAGHTGAFTYGYINGTLTPLLIPYKPLQITFNSSTQVGSFTIIDESGNSYFFNNPEISYSNASNQLTGTSSWYLSQMVSADKSDTVKFNYTTPYVFTDWGYSFLQNLGAYNTGGLSPVQEKTTQITGQQIYLTSIVFKGGRVDFKGKTGRKDNGALALDSVIVSNYDYNAKTYTRLKSFKMLTSYFYNGGLNQPDYSADSVSMYRLQLTGLSENDLNGTAVKVHQFAYNNNLPPVHNFGQDNWGYYNGNYTNQTLLQAQTITSNYNFSGPVVAYSPTPINYVIGSGQGGNRSLSPTNMQAGMLQQITYPTKGYTTFTYEPHETMLSSVSTVTDQSYAIGAYQDTTITYFTAVPAMLGPTQPSSGPADFHIYIKNTGGTGYSNSNSYVKLLQAGTPVMPTIYANSTTDVNEDIQETLTAGVQYELMAVAIGGDRGQNSTTLPQSSISTSYQVTNPPAPTAIGGLRVKTIQNYDSNGSLISSDRYKYGVNESGVGDLVTNSFLMTTVSSQYYQYGVNEQADETTYSNNSAYALSSLNGSPVAYEQVTVYHGDTVNNIGKSIYNYAVTPDSLLIWTVPQVYVQGGLEPGGNPQEEGLKPIPRLWQNGDPVSEFHYLNNGEGQYTMVQSKYTTYKNFFRTGGRGTYITFAITFSGAPRGSYNMYTNSNDFTFYDYPISVGSRQPIQVTNTNYSPDGLTYLTSDTTNYYYDNLNHMYQTRIISYDGKGDSLTKKVNYPQDMVKAGLDPTGIYAAMVSANIISPVIQFTESKQGTLVPTGTETPLIQSVTTYSNTSPGGHFEPSTVSLQTLSNPAETRLNYQQYDSNGNLLTVSKQNGTAISYIWGYNGEYPVAEVKNAPAKDVFYEGFEGGTGTASTYGTAKTGHYSHTGTYSKTLSGLDNGNYTLSYWQYSAGAWTLQSSAVTVSAGSYTISSTAQIDDIRFYPANALMTTYTYDPLIGVTSTSDAKGEVHYYQYDTFQRLMNITDQYGNIIKSFYYNYAGQASIYGNGTSAPPVPVISALSYVGPNNNIQVTFTPIPNCTSSVITLTDQTTGTKSSSAGSGSSPANVIAASASDGYSVTVTCYSNAYPSGTTSAPMVIGSNE